MASSNVKSKEAMVKPGDYRKFWADASKVAFVPLSKGKFAVVDAGDLALLRPFQWHAVDHERTSYAKGSSPLLPNRQILMHRLLADAPDGKLVDHADGNGLNNRRWNLRLCDHAQNVANQRLRDGRIYKGIKRVRQGVYSASVAGRPLGYFKTAIEAAFAYDVAARELYGQFAKCNFGTEPTLETTSNETETQSFTGKLKCPKCQGEVLRVIDSRWTNNQGIRRRRKCTGCGYRFTSLEQIIHCDDDGYSTPGQAKRGRPRKQLVDSLRDQN